MLSLVRDCEGPHTQDYTNRLGESKKSKGKILAYRLIYACTCTQTVIPTMTIMVSCLIRASVKKFTALAKTLEMTSIPYCPFLVYMEMENYLVDGITGPKH